ncbi:hypothetical protein LDENG_00246710 [Lucifuga dentata]|nr:hypothetical protein LDENG_00246710 [Lucifuga dentata]
MEFQTKWTPVDGLKSPVQTLMNQRLCSILPTTPAQLRPQVTSQKLVHARREMSTAATALLQQINQTLFKCWQQALRSDFTKLMVLEPATVTEPAHTERSYNIQTKYTSKIADTSEMQSRMLKHPAADSS